jgi:glycerate kinase
LLANVASVEKLDATEVDDRRAVSDAVTRVLIAMDKFRGTATASELCDTIADAVAEAGVTGDVQPMSDGGEGFVDAFSGDVVDVDVPGPLGQTVSARVKLVVSPAGLTAVFEVSDVVGRDLLPSPSGEDALRASSEGVGHVILAAARFGADLVLVGCGGTVTSDGGLGCYRVLSDHGGLPLPVTVATDVTAQFLEARNYASQKGVPDSELHTIDQRLRSAHALYLEERGVDVVHLERSGAAGGIPGALAALGAQLTSGVDVVAASVDLVHRAAVASLVITGEGRFDEGSLEGKVVFGVARAVTATLPLLVVCGSIEESAARRFRHEFVNATLVSLEERFGLPRALGDVRSCISQVIRDELRDAAPQR